MAKVLRAIRPFILACSLRLGYTPPGNGTWRSPGSVGPTPDGRLVKVTTSIIIPDREAIITVKKKVSKWHHFYGNFHCK